jgi:aldehyde:ferredoxin oxidoreductase
VLGAPASAIGLVESLAEATAAFMKIASGWLSDRVGRRKPLIALGYTLERMLGRRFGMTDADDRLPERLVSEPIEPADRTSVVPLARLKRDHYRQRGWDAHGVPRPGLLARLGLDDD